MNLQKYSQAKLKKERNNMGLVTFYLSVKKNNIKKQILEQIDSIEKIYKQYDELDQIEYYTKYLKTVIIENRYKELNVYYKEVNQDKLQSIFISIARITYDQCKLNYEKVSKHFDLLKEKLDILRKL